MPESSERLRAVIDTAVDGVILIDTGGLVQTFNKACETMFGYPVTCEGGEYKIVEGLPIDAFSQECIDKTLAELQGERDGVKHLL